MAPFLRQFVIALVWLATQAGLCSLVAAESVFSGPQVGESTEPFKIRQVFGDAAGEEIDVVAAADGKPLLLIFVHDITRPSIGLTRMLADYAATRAGEGLHSAVVLLTDDATKTETWMKNARHALPQKTSLGISVDGPEGPGAYGLNREVSLTMLVAKDHKVVANFALVQPSVQADGPKILTAIVDVLGGGEVPKVEDLAGGVAMRRDGRGESAGVDLRALLSPVIRRDASDEQIDKAAQAVDAQMAKSEALRNQIGDIARRIIAAGKLTDYGTARSQEHLRRWAASSSSTEEKHTAEDTEGRREERRKEEN
jgi:hypothetical protein